ncbi:MAG: MaoC family dehydratase [Minwuia sp.]|nr:MaoC family dehydratase [Minwuia sp.]
MSRWFEDIEVGQVSETDSYTMTKQEIIEFATEFDPQPFHMDEEAAKQSVFRGLCASGWHTAGILMRLQVLSRGGDDGGSMGSPGFDDLRWLKPVRPGDTLRVRSTCVEKTPSRSRPDRGSAVFLAEVINQKDEVVMDARLIGIIRKREAGPA